QPFAFNDTRDAAPVVLSLMEPGAIVEYHSPAWVIPATTLSLKTKVGLNSPRKPLKPFCLPLHVRLGWPFSGSGRRLSR
ncbi:uncharacterized protein METZ01_LOCUS450876, partial [marine metagenome]